MNELDTIMHGSTSSENMGSGICFNYKKHYFLETL
jgi:hypothetical protein